MEKVEQPKCGYCGKSGILYVNYNGIPGKYCQKCVDIDNRIQQVCILVGVAILVISFGSFFYHG